MVVGEYPSVSAMTATGASFVSSCRVPLEPPDEPAATLDAEQVWDDPVFRSHRD
jgi:hypothetical protein